MAKNKKILLIVGTIVLLVVIATICLFAFKEKEKAIYVVAFNSNSGSAIPEQNIEEGTSATKPEDPIRDGYIFIEWLLNGESYDFNTIIDKNITLSAKWEEIVTGKETFIIKFNSDGGKTIANSVIEKGSKVVKPADPTKDGYTFVEWQLDGVTYDFELEVTDNLELVAKWEENKISEKKPNKNNSGNNNNNNSQQQINNTPQPATPTLASGYGARGFGQLTIGYEGVYATPEGLGLIDGVEIYEKKGNNNILIYTSETVFSTEASADVGETRRFVARVYTYDKSNVKVYSGYSNELQITNPAPETPTLASGYGARGFGQLTIGYEGVYATPEGLGLIDGVEIYEKKGNNNILIYTSETVFSTEASADVGETRTFVARVYTYNKSNVKVYSGYSNELEITNPAPEAPTLASGYGAQGFGQLTICYEGVYAREEELRLIDGVEIYEKKGSNNTLIYTSETEFSTEASADVGETRIFVARVYTYNKSNVKVYSNYSNELVISNN